MSLKLKFSIKTREELEIPNQPKPKRSNQKENFAAHVDRVLLGEPTFRMGNGWVGPFHPVYVKAGKLIISLRLSSFHHPFGPEMTQNFKKFTCLHFYREIRKYDGPDGKCFRHF